MLLPELAEAEYVTVVARKILSAIARPFVLIGQEFRVTASVGISAFPQDGQDEQTLTKNADIAMYQAKAEGRNNFQFYSEKLNADLLERLNLESCLRQALECGEFQLHYQAKRDMASDRITGTEALLRWQHADLGSRSADAVHSDRGRNRVDRADRQVDDSRPLAGRTWPGRNRGCHA